MVFLFNRNTHLSIFCNFLTREENHRWFDLVRTGKALEVVNKNDGSSVLTVNAKAHQLLFPIPQSQIDASGKKLVQNQGY